MFCFGKLYNVEMNLCHFGAFVNLRHQSKNIFLAVEISETAEGQNSQQIDVLLHFMSSRGKSVRRWASRRRSALGLALRIVARGACLSHCSHHKDVSIA